MNSSLTSASTRRQSGLTLIELLVGIVIMGIISTMLLVSWFALQGSYGYTVNSSEQRDSAAQALAHIQAEIRDSQAPAAPSAQSAIVAASPYWIEINTTFSTAGNTNPDETPHLVLYRLYSDGTIWRYQDLNGNGVISGVDTSQTPGSATDNPSSYSLAEEKNGEGAQLILSNVTNYSANPSNPVPLFRYMYYDQTGTLQVANSVSNATYNDLSNTVAVLIRVLDDLNPGHAPVSADLQVTAQLRNQR